MIAILAFDSVLLLMRTIFIKYIINDMTTITKDNVIVNATLAFSMLCMVIIFSDILNAIYNYYLEKQFMLQRKGLLTEYLNKVAPITIFRNTYKSKCN